MATSITAIIAKRFFRFSFITFSSLLILRNDSNMTQFGTTDSASHLNRILPIPHTPSYIGRLVIERKGKEFLIIEI